MKRVLGHVIAATVLLGGGVAVGSACVHNNSTLFIRNVLAQQLVTNGQQCLYTPDPTQTFISEGILDIDFRDSYDAVYLVGNQTVPVGNAATPNTETSRITLQGGIVRITDSAGNELKTYTRYSAATVDPLQGTEPSFTPFFLTIIDSDTVAKVAGTVSTQAPLGERPLLRLVTYVRVYGYTLGGDYVESGEFEFPVDVCKGCLIRFAPQDIDPAFTVPNCAAASTGSNTSLPIPCNPGQDYSIDCSQCQTVEDCRINEGSGSTIADAGAG